MSFSDRTILNYKKRIKVLGLGRGRRGRVLPHFKLQVLDSRRKAKDFFIYKNIAKGCHCSTVTSDMIDLVPRKMVKWSKSTKYENYVSTNCFHKTQYYVPKENYARNYASTIRLKSSWCLAGAHQMGSCAWSSQSQSVSHAHIGLLHQFKISTRIHVPFMLGSLYRVFQS